ncbi:PAS domain-containing sensor histidine kinase [Phenylobacterium immobile]|uniref:PAS domain-containing sensor histidine kinase n=1 Tax=Phenylobacterium immobile TaxID=21 RepID=UPI000AA2BA01|nr:PAS domain-containing sensor histidine kinase [Phenylobacterium immobile]
MADIDRKTVALRAEDEDGRYRLLMDAITDYAIYMLDAVGRVSSWNAGAQRFKGYTADEIIGQHFSCFYTMEDRDSGLPALALRTAATEGRFEKEGWRVRKDGSRFWAHVVIDPIRGDGDEVIGFAKITRDVSDRKAAQDALEEARLALFQSQKLDAIGQLTGGVAHDFNNLLMAILGSLELVRRRLPTDPRITPLIDNAIQGAQRGAALTQRMLAFARKQDLSVSAVDLGALVRGMSGLLSQSLGHGISLEIEIPEALPPLKTDPVHLEAAILNLALNARDAMPDGGRIVIGATSQAVGPALSSAGLTPGDYVRLSVVDNGHGMDAATVERAMEPFYTTKGVGKGTGLGLSMVHGLVEQCGGRMVLHSAPGQGATVELWLPQATIAAAPVETAAAAPMAACAGLTILAVDDDGLVLMNTQAMLEELGHKVLAAYSAREALDLLASHEVDLVITDYAMPKTTGAQLAQAIQGDWPGLPIILATGYAELPVETDDRLVRLAKPFGMADLAAAMARALKPQAAEAA